MEASAGPQLPAPELLGRVLELLAPEDLRAARLAARAFDEASRMYTGRVCTLKIAPELQPRPDAARRRPAWARFPRLRRLVLGDWGSSKAAELRAVMAGGGGGAFNSVEEVDVDSSCAPLDAATWAAILARAPRVATLRLGVPHPMWGAQETAAALAAVAALAPRVARLDAVSWQLDAAAVAAAAAKLPLLESLTFNCRLAHAAGPAHQSKLWAALPWPRLTELQMRGGVGQALMRPPAEGLRWPRMRVLSEVALPAACVAALACGLPALQHLAARPEGDCWEGLELPAGAAFTALTCLELHTSAGAASFCRAAPLPRLFPALERLEWGGGAGAAVECDVPGLTRLTQLQLGHLIQLAPAVWGRMHKLRRLQELKVWAHADQLPMAPLGLATLHFAVVPGRSGDRLDACALLEAAARGRARLRRLSVCAPGWAAFSHAGLAALVCSGALASLEELCIVEPRVSMHHVGVLAVLPSLRQLTVQLHRSESSRLDADSEAQRLLAEHAERGLDIRLAG